MIFISNQEGYTKQKRFLKGTESKHQTVKPFLNAGIFQRQHAGEKNNACQLLKDIKETRRKRTQLNIM